MVTKGRLHLCYYFILLFIKLRYCYCVLSFIDSSLVLVFRMLFNIGLIPTYFVFAELIKHKNHDKIRTKDFFFIFQVVSFQL